MESRNFRAKSLVLGALPMALATVLAVDCSPQDSGGTPSTGGSAGSASTSSGTSAGTGGTAGSSTTGLAGSTAGTTGGSTAVGTSGTGGAAGDGTPGGGGGTSGGGGGTSDAGGGTDARSDTGTGMVGSSDGGSGTGGGTVDGGVGNRAPLPDPGTEGDGDIKLTSSSQQAELSSRGKPRGKSFTFRVTSKIFNGKDSTLNAQVSDTRTVEMYIPAAYKDGTPAPVLFTHDLNYDRSYWLMATYAVDNLVDSTDPNRKLPAFAVVGIPNGGGDAQGSERGLEYDTMSDRYARFVAEEVMPAAEAASKPMYPNFKFDPSPSGRAAFGCSSGAAAAFTMAWFRPDLFSRVIAYSATLVAQQNNAQTADAKLYPHGAWDYHSDLELIKNDTMGRDKLLRIVHNANSNDNGATAAESGRHNWLIANQKTAAALKAKGFHYKYIEGQGGHCVGSVRGASLADALVWVWRGYEPAK